MRNLVLVCPTWRHWLNAPADANSPPAGRERGLRTQRVRARTGLQLLGSDSFAALAAQHGLQIGFLSHPNMRGAAASIPCRHVTVSGFA